MVNEPPRLPGGQLPGGQGASPYDPYGGQPQGPAGIPQQSWGQLPPPPTAPPAYGHGGESTGTGAAVVLVLLGCWAALLAVVGQFVPWAYDQVVPGQEHPGTWLTVTLLLGVLTGVPALLAWRLGKHAKPRLVARAWAVAGGAVTLLAPLRLLPAQSMLVALVSAAVLAVLTFVLSRLPAFAVARGKGDGGTLVALGAGLLTVLPFAVYGAFGGVADTLLGVLLAAAIGWLTAVLLAPLWRECAAGWSRVRTSLLGGLVAGTTVVVLVAGAAPRVSGLWLAVCAPAIGFVCAAASYASPRKLPTFAGVTAATVGTLVFLDPDEVNVLVGTDILQYAAVAGGLGLVACLVASGVFTALAGVLRSRALGALVAVVALLVAGGGYALGGQPGMTTDRLFVVLGSQAKLDLPQTGDLDERRKATYDQLVAHANEAQAPLREALDGIGVDYTPYYLVNAIEVDAGAELKPWLASRDDVDEVLDSPRLRPLKELTPPDRGQTSKPPDKPQWNLTMVNADETWDELGVTGEGVVVGQSDSGVDGEHPALRDSYRGRGGSDDYNWLDPWYGTTSPTDKGGHGTHTAGSAVGKDVGVAPGADWIGCVNLGRNLGNPALYLNCLQFMLAPYPQDGDPLRDGDPARAADVLNNSWGCPPLEGCDADVLGPAIRALIGAGMFVVASAGNDGPSCNTVKDPIAIYPDAFSVGAVTNERTVAPYSSRGPVTADGSDRAKPDIAAPGGVLPNDGVRSSLPGGGYGDLQGTSMAGPHVTGVVALMWSANPALKGDVERTAEILRSTTQEAVVDPESGGECGAQENVVGAGIVDAYAAVEAAKQVN